MSDTTTVRRLRDERGRLWGEARSLLDAADREGRELTAEERSQYDTLDAKLTELTGQIDTRERAASWEARLNAPKDVPGLTSIATPASDKQGQFERAFEAYAKWGTENMAPEDRSVLYEQRAQGVGTSTAGGYFVPAGFRQQIIETLVSTGSVRSVAEVLTTDTGNTISWPTADDSGNVGAILAENTVVTEQDVVIGTATLGAYKYTSKLVRVSRELIQDSAFDVGAWLSDRLGVRIGRIQNQHFTTGTGTAQPQGIVTGATAGVTLATGQTTGWSSSANAIDSLLDLIHSIDPLYRNGANAKFMMNDGTLSKVRHLKDADNRPLWEPSFQNGTPDRILGYPVVINPDMPVMAAGAKSVLFGDFRRGYLVRDVLGVAVLRLEERYADYFQVGFVGFARSDGRVQDAAAFKALVNSAT